MKKEYIVPRIEAFHIPPANMLTTSPPNEIPLPWSGDSEGTAGPGEIDENSTTDTF